jgi:hypothetical protein
MLDAAAAEAVLAHLDACPECRQAANSLSGDSLRRLRAPRSSPGTAADARSPIDTVGAGPVARSPGLAPTTPYVSSAIPPELRDHADYEVLRELGRGGMGVVYLARNKLMDRPEVLKVVNQRLLGHSGAAERFVREIRAAAKLSHPNIVTAHSAFQVGDVLVFAMEYIEGETLAQFVHAYGRLPPANACYYAQQAALGLQHATDKGMVHRDIKPQNLILAREGKKHVVKILDFGLAKATREEEETERGLTGSGAMMGTPDYIAPEQTLDAARADIRADIYSLGCTIYYMLTGSPPFKANSQFELLQAHQSREATPLNQLRSDVPTVLANLVAKMMAKEPAKRYQKPAEVAQALAPFVKGTGKGPPTDAAKAMGPGTGDKTAAGSGQTAAPARMASGTIVESHDTIAHAMQTLPDQGRVAAARYKWAIAVGVAVLMLVLVGLWAGGVINPKKEGVLVVEVNEPNPDIFVDGEKVTVTWDDGGKKAEIPLKPGTRKVEVKKNGFSVYGEEVEIAAGKHRILTATLSQLAAQGDGNLRPFPDSGFVSLFNGKDTSGWKTHPKQPGNWRVENGIIIGSGPAASHLYTARDDYQDYHLRLDMRVNGDYGGVFVRAAWPTMEPWWPLGYGAGIQHTAGKADSTVSLFVANRDPAVVSVPLALAATGDWLAIDLIVQGDRIIIKVNGTTTVDYTDEKRYKSSGHIVLQQHNPRTVGQFRNIEIKELKAKSAKGKTPPGAEEKQKLDKTTIEQAIRRVISEDRELGRRRNPNQGEKMLEHVRRIELYCDQAEKIDLNGCPADFQASYKKHIGTWRELPKCIRASLGKEDLEAVDVGSYQVAIGKNDNAVKNANEQIKLSWDDVERVAETHGVVVRDAATKKRDALVGDWLYPLSNRPINQVVNSQIKLYQDGSFMWYKTRRERFVFRSTGAAVITDRLVQSTPGTYKVMDGSIVFTDSNGDKYPYKYRLDGNILTLDINGTSLGFERVP